MKLEQLDVEHPGERPHGMPHHHLYGHEREHPRTPVAFETDHVTDGWLVRVFGIPEILARRTAQLVTETHGLEATR